MLLWSASDTNRHWFHKTNPNTKIFLTFLQMLTPEPVRLSCLLHSLTEVSWWRETELAYGSTRTVPPRPGCAVPKHSGLLSQWYQDKEAPHNAELHGWNTLKAELREQHPSQQHKKRLNYDMPHFFFFFYLARLAERWFCLPGGYKPLTCACDTPAARENSHNWMLPCATTHTLQSWPLWEFIAQGHIAGG